MEERAASDPYPGRGEDDTRRGENPGKDVDGGGEVEHLRCGESRYRMMSKREREINVVFSELPSRMLFFSSLQKNEWLRRCG